MFAISSILLIAFGATAETTNTFSDAEIQGHQLAQQLCEARPTENSTNTGVLKIRDAKGKRSEIPIRVQTQMGTSRWSITYETMSESNRVSLIVIHANEKPNRYQLFWGPPIRIKPPEFLSGDETMMPFANSDFWLADLGLEFFYWPAQKVLKKEFRRNCSCVVLESANPNPGANGYSRVDSWIDEESSGIVEAKAYDAQGKLLKEFYPKDVKKVKGQWQVQSMVLDNVQAGSRTRLEFDLKAP